MFKRGSEWRLWDLQVHTPYSLLNNQFGNDWDEYTKQLFKRAIENEIAVIGITDYYTIKGYETLKNILANETKLNSIFKQEIKQDKSFLDKVKDIKILPCIEFRFKDVVVNHGRDNKIETNIIFSDELSVEDIKNKFLSEIKFLNENSEKTSLNDYNIEEFGKKIKEVQPELRNKSDYVVGLEMLSIEFENITDVLKNSIFKDRYMILIPEDDITTINWSSSAHMTRKKYYKAASGLFSVNENSIKWGLKEETKTEFATYKPCFSCSDCHKFDEMFKFKSGKKCWIKADPTFDGLLQVTFQPLERIYVGEKPEKLKQVNNQKYYYMDRIYIGKNAHAKNSDTWFSSDIPLNPGLIAIIGNKGSGKSALADILGYMSDSHNMINASFLTKERFRKEDKKYADDYQSKLFWKDGRIVEKNSLDEDITNIQNAEYLPQKYIEELCNELNDKFQKEINNVIFSYIDVADKNQCATLDELITKKTTDIDYKIKKYRNDIETINKQIIELEGKFSISYRKEIELNLKQKREQLKSNEKNKPKEIPKPTDLNSSEEIKELNKNIENIEKLIHEKQSEKLKINIKIDKIKQYLEKFKFAQQELLNLTDEGNELCKNIELDFKVDVAIKSNVNELEKHLDELIQKKQILENHLEENSQIDIDETHTLLYVERRNMIEEREKLLTTAHDSEIKYQKYLDDLKSWEIEKIKINGQKVTDEDTIMFYQNELHYIDEKLYTDLDNLRNRRIVIVLNIYKLLKDKMEVYKTLYKPVEEKLKKILSSNNDDIEFETIININNSFKDEFMSLVRQNVDSVYKGRIEGLEYLNSSIRGADFNSELGIKEFVEKIQNSVSGDVNVIKKLIPNTIACYNLINKLEFLNISFTLKMDGKMLNELSPGQRGNVLLIFYLALSKNCEPLIIDQPEDNLDNQSVFDKLVPCIIEAKKHRQVIIVTHNPNIAIACDAEQIVVSNIDKISNQITYQSGSIENPEIREQVINVLEGTMPAFKLRRKKYFE